MHNLLVHSGSGVNTTRGFRKVDTVLLLCQIGSKVNNPVNIQQRCSTCGKVSRLQDRLVYLTRTPTAEPTGTDWVP